MKIEVLDKERLDRSLIKATIRECIKTYDKEREVNDNITSGEMTNRIVVGGLTLSELVEVYNYFYNGGYPDYQGYDYQEW